MEGMVRDGGVVETESAVQSSDGRGLETKTSRDKW